MQDISTIRLNLLRGGYLLLVLGIGAAMWPTLISKGPDLELMHGAALSMLCAVGLLAVLGLRRPLQMLPLLMFEMTWKTIWLLRIAVPVWSAGRLDGNYMSTVAACLVAVVFPFIIPWSYVMRTYIGTRRNPGARSATAQVDARGL